MTRTGVARVAAVVTALALTATGAATLAGPTTRAAAAPSDATTTWHTETLADQPAPVDLPVLVRFAPDGTRYVGFLHNGEGVTVTVTPPDGGAGQTLDLGPTNAVPDYGAAEPSLCFDVAIGPTGTAAVAWTDPQGVPHVRTRPAGSTAWSGTTDFPSSADDAPTVAVSRAGGLTVAWVHHYNGTGTVEAATGNSPADPSLTRVQQLGPTTYLYTRHLQAGYASGFAQLVWEQGGSSADDGTDSSVYLAGYSLFGEPTGGWSWYTHLPNSGTYTSSHPVLLTDDDEAGDGDAAVVYERDLQTPTQTAVAVVPYFYGRPEVDSSTQAVYPAPGLRTVAATMTGNTVTAVWHTADGTASATEHDETSTPAAPLTLSTGVLDVTALVTSADGTQALVFQGTDGLPRLVRRDPGATAWSDAGQVPRIGGYPSAVGVAMSRAGTLVASGTDAADDDPGMTAHVELMSTDVTGQGGLFHPVATTRVLDTRSGVGARRGQLGPGGSLVLRPVTAVGVGAVQLNVTATAATGPGYLQLYPTAATPPSTSSVNFAGGQNVANLVTVATAPDGSVTIRNGPTGVAVDVVADLTGWFQAGTAGRGGETVAIAPARLLDTRNGTGGSTGPVTAGGDARVTVTGRAGVPASVAAVLLNVTATDATGSGFLASHASGTPTPGTSDLNFTAGQVVAAGVLVPVGADGAVEVHHGGGGVVDVVVDVEGYVTAGTAALPGALALTAPTRLVDTRVNTGDCVPGPITSCPTVTVAGYAGVPADGVAAAVFTATATDTTNPGFLSVTTGSSPTPTATSSLNFTTGKIVANAVWSLLGTAPDFSSVPGTVAVAFGPAGTRGNVILDLRGYVLS